MTKQRIKVALPTITSRDEAEQLVNEIAQLANDRRHDVAVMDERILAIKEQHAPALALIDEAIALKTDTLRAWAEANPDEFGKKKSIKFLNGVLGFRTGTPKLALISRAWNWDKVLTNLLAHAPVFVRQKPEVDKDGILASAAATGVKEMPELGIKVVQDETFFVEPVLTPNEVQS